jgi:hypothetical protein
LTSFNNVEELDDPEQLLDVDVSLWVNEVRQISVERLKSSQELLVEIRARRQSNVHRRSGAKEDNRFLCVRGRCHRKS